ncbi:hypothetical protein NQ314_005468 [Rhamnusium bicolor]|uniref:HIT-type domain-containing protein n=1 Tax=Rhamnusium bicolor TaxID=1586634 RepID=A0AAV8ZGT3_9CUCU|nr:hypothetical protein NQ314_005468 [Rhamnusium bicolor]
MNKTCNICHKEGIYKCPTCFIFYCSVTCCRKHRENKCGVVKNENVDDEEEQVEKKRKIEGDSTVPEEKIEMLKSNEEVNKLLTNSHLRNLLVIVDKAENAEEIMQKAMQEPIFVEFADACLKVVEPETQEDT